MQITPLVTAFEGEARASSETIARGIGIQHKNVLALLRRHQSDFDAFGRVAFETRTFETRGGKQQREFALLNEHQAGLLIAFMRNSPKVIEFKVALIREFFRMRDELQHRERGLWRQMQELIAKEVESKVRASFGSHLMLERKREIPALEHERFVLEQHIQPQLFHH
ncbi:Rha family transcriptional regulator [Curvibacter lanceolatus]|uniref:Rha family transcriptional regulator n=1 Tax=Curvibacter lanceolatus TaxID=86182 RepID=UPI0003818DDC|nr:Rha family transcriptional regulator [Curvibacter lanceolatus]